MKLFVYVGFYVLVVWLFLLTCVQPHPQCLNHLPPFTPRDPLKFCTEYDRYTCCTSDADEELRQVYEEITASGKNNDTDDGSQECNGALKDLLCLRCHPYAAHVFDAEVSYANKTFKKSDVNFPGLCFRYCYEKFSVCRQQISELTIDESFKTFMLNSTINDFCKWAEIPDKLYCYPYIKEIDKEIDLKRREGSDDIKLCVQADPDEYTNPLVGVHSNDGTHRLFVGEQRGVVFVLDQEGRRQQEPFLDIRDRIINSGQAWDERGFLGLVFHPRYRRNGHFYVFYSAPNNEVDRTNMSDYDWYWRVKHTIQVSEFTVDPNNPNRADHNSEMVLLRVKQPAANHNGGMIFFGYDGYLYISLGDGGGAGDQYRQALDLTTLLGAILRIDVHVEDHLYAIPPSNPFVRHKTARKEIFAYGCRNMWRCSVDRGDRNRRGKGRIFCGDVGQSRFEEIDIIKHGRNYGWSAYEGNECYNKTLCAMKQPDIEFPILTYNHTFGQSIVGGYVYRGCNKPKLYGQYIFGDTMNGNLFIGKEGKNGQWTRRNILMGNESVCNHHGLNNEYFQNILSFAETEAGELLILSVRWPNPYYRIGKIYRLVDPLIRGDPAECRFNVRQPEALGKIRRRRVWQKYVGKVTPTKITVPVCTDHKRSCKKWFTTLKGQTKPNDYDWYWRVKHTIQVSEFTVDPNNPNRADHNSEMVLLRVKQPAANHNGGMIFFGYDGYLYISLGDGGGAGDQYRQALDLTTLLGAILRIDVHVEDHLYAIPPSNPFVRHKTARKEIFAYGCRNMWRCSVDRGDRNRRGKGRIFCGDVGQSRFEEIDIIKHGRNYGWSAYEGNECYNKTLCAMKQPDIEYPILTYNHSFGQSIVGGYVYRGCNKPKLYGQYIFGDTMNGNLFIGKEGKNGQWTRRNILMGNESVCNHHGLNNEYFQNILSFGETEAGELLILSVRWPNPYYRIGKIYRLVDPLIRGDPAECRFKVRQPEALGRIRRRRVWQKYVGKPIPTKKTVPVGTDHKRSCRKWFTTLKGQKKPKYDCKKLFIFANRFCKKTCNYCKS